MVILRHCDLMVMDMRFLPVLVLVGLPGAAIAQATLPEVQKAAQPPLAALVSEADLGIPANGDAAKTALLAGSKAADATASDFDTDKITGNEPVSPPLGLRQKMPGQAPADVTEADFGQPANDDAPKIADLAVSHGDATPTIYDEDKIDGNEPPPAPLAERQKSPSFGVADTGDADQGVPGTPPDPKLADLAVSHADGVLTEYDEDKIAGNAFVTGPLAERQKYPSELAEGADPTTFGQPAIDAPKEADLGVSKAEIDVPNLEDNDKIAGNPYVTPPLLPRQKAPSDLPDPVADADMGQPAIDAPKVELAVSKDAEDRPNIEDNDKIDGNPVVNPPLTERSKGPAYEAAIAGLSNGDLGLPAAPDAAKTADIGVSKTADAVTTEYDEDKIAGNSYQDPAFDSGSYEGFDIAPPAELVAQVRALLDDPATRTSTLDGVAARGLAPEAILPAFQSFLGILYDTVEVRDLMAEAIARVFVDVGLTPDNPAAVGRMAAEYIAAFGENEAWRGTARRSPEEQRAYLTDLLRVAATLPPEQCAPYLDGTMDTALQRRLLLTAMATWPEDDRNAMFIHRAAAILADVQDNPQFEPMAAQIAQGARAMLGEAALAAIDAAENGPALLVAFGDPAAGTPAENCAVQTLILQAALAKTGADGDLVVRYLVENGWSN